MLMPVGPSALKLMALADISGAPVREKMNIAKFLAVGCPDSFVPIYTSASLLTVFRLSTRSSRLWLSPLLARLRLVMPQAAEPVQGQFESQSESHRDNSYASGRCLPRTRFARKPEVTKRPGLRKQGSNSR